jgi:surface antigen
MKTLKTSMALVLASGLALSGCANEQYGQKQTGGLLAGAALGGLLGSQFGHGTGKVAMTGLGVALGGLMGSEVGKSLDRADQAALERNTRAAWTGPMNQEIIWDNPQNDHRVIVTPTREGRTPSGGYCREYQQKIIVGGRTEEAYGRACQQPDGSWKIVS